MAFPMPLYDWRALVILFVALAGGRRAQAFAPRACAVRRVRPDTRALCLRALNTTLPGSWGASTAVGVDASGQRQLKEVPGPINWPIVGNMVSMVKTGGMDLYTQKLYRRFGPVFRARLLGVNFHVVAEPDLVKEMFTTKLRDLEDRFIMAPVAETFGNRGIIFANGHEAATNRRMSVPAFHRPEILDRACVIVADQARRRVDRYLSQAPGLQIDLSTEMQGLTLEVVSLACFSLPMGFTDPQAAPYPRMGELVRRSFRLIGKAIRFPVPNAYKVGLNPHVNHFRRTWAELSEMEDKVIEERRAVRRQAALEGKTIEAKDLLDVYMEAMEQGGEGVEQLSNESIRKNVHDLLLAGGDTTAQMVASCVHEVTRRPDVLAKVRAELAGFELDNPQHMSPDGLHQRLPYLEMCMKEALRLFPAALQINRVASRETSLGQYRIAEGAVVAAGILIMHREKAIWGPDADQFRPERWEAGKAPPHPQAFMPFGAGPRICLGMRFACMEGLAIMAVLLKRLDMAPLDPQADLRPHYPSAIQFKGGVQMVVNGPAPASP